jgi:hypothetical protein
MGIATTLAAQTNINQPPLSSIQDSVAFHQWLMELAEERTSGHSNSMQNLNVINSAGAPYTGQIRVPGNANTFYPVAFKDVGWYDDKVTILNISRANIHYDGMWFGSMMSTFRYRLNFWSNGSNFIDADVVQSGPIFIGGWEDATYESIDGEIVIWLRGGRHYFWSSNYPQTPRFNTNANGGPIAAGNRLFSVRTQPDPRFTHRGLNLEKNLWVAGTVRAREVRVDVATGADFVFEPDYNLRPLEEVEQFIIENRHLPEIAPARDMIENGIDVSEFQIQLLQKIEELTLYIIEQNRRLNALETEIRVLKNK